MILFGCFLVFFFSNHCRIKQFDSILTSFPSFLCDCFQRQYPWALCLQIQNNSRGARTTGLGEVWCSHSTLEQYGICCSPFLHRSLTRPFIFSKIFNFFGIKFSICKTEVVITYPTWLPDFRKDFQISSWKFFCKHKNITVLPAYVKNCFLQWKISISSTFIFYKGIQRQTLPNVLGNVLHYRLCAVNLISNSMQRKNCWVYLSDLYYDLISVLVVWQILTSRNI